MTKNKLLANLIERGYQFRDVEVENIAKMLSCGTSLMCRKHYTCENKASSHTKVICQTCKSRFFNSCGQKTTHKKQTKNYIGRYLKKPPIATSRLKHMFGDDVTFEYLEQRDNHHKGLTLTQEEMLLRLLSHIPEKYFKMVRYLCQTD